MNENIAYGIMLKLYGKDVQKNGLESVKTIVERLSSQFR